MDIGGNIRKLRVGAGYTQKQLAGIIGVKGAYISALERGLRQPGKKILPLLCDALCVDELTILYGERLTYYPELSPAEKLLLVAIAGLTNDQLRAVIEFIKELTASGTMILRDFHGTDRTYKSHESDKSHKTAAG